MYRKFRDVGIRPGEFLVYFWALRLMDIFLTNKIGDILPLTTPPHHAPPHHAPLTTPPHHAPLTTPPHHAQLTTPPHHAPLQRWACPPILFAVARHPWTSSPSWPPAARAGCRGRAWGSGCVEAGCRGRAWGSGCVEAGCSRPGAQGV